MKLEDTFKAAYNDFKRDFEPDDKRQEDAFIEGFRYGINVLISYIIESGKGGEKYEKRN